MESVPLPTATNRFGSRAGTWVIHYADATPLAVPVITVAPRPVHVMPSAEYASVLVPFPPATNRDPFHVTLLPSVEKIDVLFVTAVQLVPLDEYAMEFVP